MLYLLLDCEKNGNGQKEAEICSCIKTMGKSLGYEASLKRQV